MVDFILIAILLGIASAIVFYLIREKKRGVTCVGCPHGKQCAARKSGKGCGNAEKTSGQEGKAQTCSGDCCCSHTKKT